MAQLTHAQYDALERAVMDGTRIVVRRRGGREFVLIPLSIRTLDGREAIEARNPVTSDNLTIFLDDIDGIEVVR